MFFSATYMTAVRQNNRMLGRHFIYLYQSVPKHANCRKQVVQQYTLVYIPIMPLAYEKLFNAPLALSWRPVLLFLINRVSPVGS